MPNKDESPQLIDIREDDLQALSAEVLDTLLRDHTTGRNIFWATHDYEALGPVYDYHSEILPHLITGEHGMTKLVNKLFNHFLYSSFRFVASNKCNQFVVVLNFIASKRYDNLPLLYSCHMCVVFGMRPKAF